VLSGVDRDRKETSHINPIVLMEAVLHPDVVAGTMRILGDSPNSILDSKDYLESTCPFAWNRIVPATTSGGNLNKIPRI
jgi:hypothetical protein